ncbi:protocadherin Fat 4-like [Argopecten irradians]|uniref:protocadherin Fat 4-like n=1 Tax=Argopecten irradians TaxID=31199 RepID=UPI00371078C7
MIKADDQDPTDNLTFILVHEQDFRLQTVDNRSATILINNALDRERTPEGYNLTLKVTDSLHTSTATLSVIIEDVNDNAPIFNPATYSFSINEGVSNQGIGNVTATDQDKGNNGSVEYTLLPPWDGNFSIERTGQIKVKSALDRESLVATSGQISLLVLAKDKGTPPLMTSAILTIHVGDVNDHAPHFKEKELSITINEGQMLLRHIEAYDEDVGRNQAIHYFIGNHNISTVEIKNNTLRSNTSLTYGVYEVEVIAYNTVPYTVSGLKNGTMTVFIHVKDINNHRPHFNRSSYEFSLPENFNVGHLVNRSIVWIHADDADETSEFNTVTYSVVEKDSYFDIDPLTATLRLIKPLDFEKAKYVHFKVMATDGDPNHQETVNVNVTILDVNDNAPVFSLDIYKCSVEEKRIRLLNCSTNIHATDNDTVGNNGKLTYSIEGPIKDIFSINASTGELRPTSPLDADAGPSLYAIKIKAVDGGSPPLSGTAVVEVTVTNVNDNTPVIHGPSHITIPENLPINTTVGSLFATDVDINDNLTFTLSTTVIDDSIRTSRTTKTPVVNGNDNAVFRLNVRQTENPGSVEIILNKALDRESISRFNLTVAVSDSVHNSSFKLEVSIDDVNDNSPVFSAATYNFTVDEEAPQKEIGIVNATDIDMNENGRLRYTVLPPWESYFNITNTGQIKTVLALDRESLPSRSKDKISLIIMAKDEGTFPLMATATVTATDEDEGINGQIHYNISYTNATFLEVEDHTLISKHQMKFGVYKVEIKASNPVSYTAQVQKPQNDTLMVYIHVQDINNHSPKFENTPYAISLHENYDVGRIVNASIKARDDDETSEYNTVSYSVADKDGYFDIDPRTALLRLIKPLDHAKEPHIRFQVKASDGDISHDVSVNVSVTVTDVNDHAPVFSSAVYNCTIMENDTSPITCLQPINATDTDSGENGKINYSIEGFAQHIFNINNTNGVIYPFSPLDYDAGVHNYVLTVLATDNGTPQMTGSTVIDISIEDKNDNSPVIHGPRQFSIPENASLGTTLGVMFVTDADADNNLVFTLSDNTDFHIESDTGELSTARKFDYENNDRLIRVNVSVYDGQHTTFFPIAVAITNVNDNSPIFVNSSLTPTISEDMENPFFYIQATDDDADSSLIYTITSITSTYIHIDSTSGLVTIDGSINAVDNGTITFSVSVTDGKHVVPANVRVNVIDVNDNAPRFTNSTYTFHVKEEIDYIFVGKVMATDEDPGDNGKLRYSILTPWDNVFSVNETGHIEVKSKLDREALISDQITMSVTARDLGTPSFMSIAIVLVHVQDVNDHAPKFQENAMNISIDEGRLVNYQIQAYDEDEGTNHEIYYVIGSKNISRVEIQNNTLRSKAPLTYGVYEVDIIAHNTVPYTVPGLKNGTMTAYIYVQDINNNSPNFDQKSYTFSIHDDFEVGRLVNQSFSPIHAHDADETPKYSTVTYSISNDNGYFEIDPRTATLRLIKSLDYAKEALIDFQVTADDGDKSHQVSVNVSVDVVDANNHTPMFSSELYNCSVEENVTSAIVCRSSINATDGDRGTNGEIHYSIEGQMKSIFTIDNTNGVIRPLLPLDYDTGPRRYILFVQAKDNGKPKRTSSAVVEVIVKDKNDNIPVIHGPSYFTIPENSPVNTTIGTVFATDEDALDELMFSLTDNADFHIQRNTGILLSGRSFDYEKKRDRLMHVNVSVSDGQHIAYFPISVAITNLNDNSPVFVNSSLTHTISEDMDDPSFYIQATDKDMDSMLTYSIPSHGHRINIENESGLVTIYGPLNAQDNGTITFDVNVTDGKHSVSASVRVQVIDVNDNAPIFENATYTFSVAEEDDSAVVGNVKANDDDQGENRKVQYDILSPW